MMNNILSGLRVIESSAFVAVPMAGMTLSQMGAEVIRFDRLEGGLDARRMPYSPSGSSLFWSGMNKGRKSYERENPGSDLKAPSKKVGNKRRSSFCARMKGMKKKLTSAKTANDPDSRINKSLRAWNC